MNLDLIDLALEQIMGLNDQIKTLHDDLEKWRDPPLNKNERWDLSYKVTTTLEEQKRWIRAVMIAVEEAKEKE